MRSSVKAVMIFFFVIIWNFRVVHAEIYPQIGIDGYIGPNQLKSTTPWIGVRFGFSNSSSAIFKIFHQKISYEYLNNNEEKERIDRNITYLTPVYYFQKKRIGFYSAVSLILGTQDYSGMALDIGGSFQIMKKIKIEGGYYYLKENSTLWYPDEAKRSINVNSYRIGILYSINKNFSLNPRVYISKNSEKVKSQSYSFGVIYTPAYPYYFTVCISRYHETSQYRFSGYYLLVGLNMYL